MSNIVLPEVIHLVNGLPPAADVFSGTVYSDIVSLKEFGQVTFILYRGVGSAGTTLITVEACDTISPGSASAVTFQYRSITSTDVPGALTAATTAGFTTGAGTNAMFLVTATINDVLADGNGYQYIRLKCVEDDGTAVLGGILVILSEPRSPQSVDRTQIT